MHALLPPLTPFSCTIVARAQVSICKTPIPEILENPLDVIWKDYSIEFCGGTHLVHTGEAQKFVILSEEGVAKGIRRILAVTKDTAAECSASGSRILASLERCEALPSSLVGPDAAALRKELDQSFISAPLKTSMRLRLETIQKRAQEAAKAEAGRKLNAVLGEVTEAVEKKQVCVIKFTGIEGKGAQKIAEKVKKANPDCSFFGVIEGEDGKVSCFASMPDGREALVRATAGGGGGAAPALLRELAATPLDAAQRSHLPSVLTHAAQHAEGRSQLLETLAGAGGAALTGALCAHLGAPDELRRLGVARLLRNLAFAARCEGQRDRRSEAAEGAAAPAAEVPEPGAEAARAALLSAFVLPALVTAAAARLAPVGAHWKDEDRADFSAGLTKRLGLEPYVAPPVVEGAPPPLAPEDERGGGLTTSMTEEEAAGLPTCTPLEPCAETRLALTEALLLLSAAREGCEAMRSIGIYPLCREAHLCEEERGIKEANEQLVEEFFLKGVAPPPNAAADAAAGGVEQLRVAEPEPSPIEEVVD